ncbi:hyphally regulated cell wall protein 1-like [Haliotis rufescens]|uniref:hyphally regulated cell wall protein 1-like n=1 Tax=Haliotis rufescens TaxID=6454 RepID=UPI00201EB825|nr:hyphally regulated cell wall protein 1-like [Haliotis rufescens]
MNTLFFTDATDEDMKKFENSLADILKKLDSLELKQRAQASCYCLPPGEFNLMKKQLDNARAIYEEGSTHHAMEAAINNTPSGSNNARETGTPSGSNNARETGTPSGSNNARETGTPSGSNNARETGTPSGSNNARETGTPSGSNNARETDTPSGSNNARETDTASGSNNEIETDTASGSNNARETDTPRRSNNARETDTPRRSNNAGETGTPSGSNNARETGTPSGSNNARETDTPRRSNNARETDTPKGANKTREGDAPKRSNNITEKTCLSHPGYSYLEDSLCFRFSAFKDVRNWKASRKTCQEDGGDLMTFYRQREVDVMVKYLNGLGESAYDSVSPMLKAWVGMRRVAGKYQWVTDSTFSGGWGQGEPLNLSVYKCVSFMYDGIGDGLCTPRLRYLCRIRTDSTSPTQGDAK